MGGSEEEEERMIDAATRHHIIIIIGHCRSRWWWVASVACLIMYLFCIHILLYCCLFKHLRTSQIFDSLG